MLPLSSTFCGVSLPPLYTGDLEPLLGISDVLKYFSSDIHSSPAEEGGGMLMDNLALLPFKERNITVIHL